MRRRDVIGLDVVVAETGERLGRVEDVLVTHPAGRIVAFLLEGSGGEAAVFPFEEVRAVGEGAILVESGACPLSTRRKGRLRVLLHRHRGVIGRRLLGAGGEDLGTIEDLDFDPASGRVTGYEVSGGLLEDLRAGRRFLPVTPGMVFGPDAVVWT